MKTKEERNAARRARYARGLIDGRVKVATPTEKQLAKRRAKLNWYYRNPERSMLISARQRAKQIGVPFALSLQDIEIPIVCPVLDRLIVPRHPDLSPSLDRRVPALGYVPGNVRVISRRANRLKSDASLEELRALVAYMEAA